MAMRHCTFATTIPVTPAVIPHYDVLVFSLTNLSSTLHTLNISTTGPTTSYVNFDYAIYTYARFANLLVLSVFYFLLFAQLRR